MKKFLCIVMSLILVLVMIPMVSGAFAGNEPAPETPDYLCFTAEKAGSTIQLNRINFPEYFNISLEYSMDLSKPDWKKYIINSTTGYGESVTLTNVNDKVYFKASNTNKGFSSYSENGGNNLKGYKFVMSGQIAASGNIMSLLDSTCNSKEIPCEYCFAFLFQNYSALTSSPDLPATSLKSHCYDGMFYKCASLTNAPALPARELQPGCYKDMFFYCQSLESAPMLPAKELKEESYFEMFSGCNSLKTVYMAISGCLSQDNHSSIHEMFSSTSSELKITVPSPTNFFEVYHTGYGIDMTNLCSGDYSSTVNFIVGNSNNPISRTDVEFLGFITSPTNDPASTHVTITDWFTEKECTNRFEFDTTPIVTNTNLYAMFEHGHDWDYTTSSDAASLTASCTNQYRNTPCESVTVTLKASDTEYTRVPYSEATLTNYEQFHNETAATATEIEYYLAEDMTPTDAANSGAADLKKAPVKGGNYVAKVTINTAKGSYTIAKNFCIEDWTYSTTTDFTLKATFRNLERTVSLNTPDIEYTGTAYNIATLTDYEQFHNDTEATKTDITYYLEGGATPTNASNSDAAGSGKPPVKAGKYVAKVTINTTEGSFELEKSFEIKAKPSNPGGYYIPTADNTKKTDEKIKEIEEKAALKEKIAAAEISMKSSQTKLNGYTAIKITWVIEGGDLKIADLDNYEIFRSTKKNSGYGKKPYFTSSKPDYGYYVNNKGLKKGKTYYYKVRGFKVIDGVTYYTPWSKKCWRTVK